ncbi:MAG: hypothetical protein A2Y67_00685 [Candidatus Buchananbacteria bacterium RBG_13_39_9]|uniref:Uncharacterized protein n=1 Tax=Candidatus Buchananbacteria bacterium RBG_13_39_9 TaxID=1797531 RepID=A0A1G1XM05_9BACT|nr:MAG: hypothetical protein A2Y67_00685 [Candidatus Buchananbacteria bacterium RBG_13_39_9]
MVQVASFLAHSVTSNRQEIRKAKFDSLDKAQEILDHHQSELVPEADDITSIKYFIELSDLRPLPELDIDQAQVDAWNEVLEKIFESLENQQSWDQLFTITYQLRGEAAIFEAFGIK